MGKIFLVLFFITKIVHGLYEGDQCTSFGTPGTCRVLGNCPQAVQLLIQFQQFPETCGYEGTVPIVCCTEAGGPQTTKKPTPTTTATTTPRPTRSRLTTTTTKPTSRPTKRPEDYAPGDLAEEKCYEYGKYVYELIRPPIGLADTYVNQSVCGFKAKELIVGGTKATPYEFPHQALLGFQKENEISWQCGGALISENYVLSAAHCAATSDLGSVKYVRLGELDYGTDNEDAKPQDIIISQIIKHPSWKPPIQYNDIMLLKLEKPATFNRWVRPVCLHTTFKIGPTNSQSDVPRFIATGWGRTQFGGDVSTHLLKVTLDSFNQEQCSSTYRSTTKRRLPNGINEKSQLCAGGMDEDKDTCQGDSGGPLQIYSKKVYCMYELVGITSFGKACGIKQVPGVYTRVSEYIDWIEKIIWKN